MKSCTKGPQHSCAYSSTVRNTNSEVNKKDEEWDKHISASYSTFGEIRNLSLSVTQVELEIIEGDKSDTEGQIPHVLTYLWEHNG